MARKQPAVTADKGKRTRRAMKRVYSVKTTSPDGVVELQLFNAATKQAARAAATGQMTVELATPSDLMQAGAMSIELVEV